MWKREYLSRNRGLQADIFSDAMKAAGASPVIADTHYSIFKPKNVPAWNHRPATPAEEALYMGTHIHAESNPLGLHTHVKGGKLTGGHSHGPQNRFGGHHHKKGAIETSVSIDGSHVHEAGRNYPNGDHEHCPENFG